MTVHVFGIRHHGPGCARSLQVALAELRPDAILVEGPPEANALLPLALDGGMRPPVAILIYRPDVPRRAVVYPLAAFSPEWQAIRFGLERALPVRFCDLGQAVQLRDGEETDDGEEVEIPEDPLGMLAQAAGYPDFELWWDAEIERRADPAGLFDAILEAMGAARQASPPPGRREARREASMRQAIHRAEREGFVRIAVVCGAWHAPTLLQAGSPDDDRSLLADLPRTDVEAVWIPWTNFRLSYRSGYGAGITSPGWYDHLWTTPHRTAIEWIGRAARLLRAERLDAPASGVIDAARLSEALAALRDRHVPGLDEMRDTILTTLCGGHEAPLRLIQEQLEVGDAVGAVPERAAAVPLQRDVEREQRRLRLPVAETPRDLDLDLRRDLDRDRSFLLHRLRLLDVPWGSQRQVRGKSGTFHELWQLRWDPALVIELIDKSPWGNTVADAANAYLMEMAGREADLPPLARLLEGAILANLDRAGAALLQALQRRAAASPAVQYLMEALPPLAQVARYGDVRGTRADQVVPVIDGLLARILVELPAACTALDDDAARQMLAALSGVRETISVLDRADLRGEWHAVLGQLGVQESAHALLRGWSCQALLEGGALDGGELQRLAGLALSPATPAEDAAAWIEGVLQGSALVLLQQGGLWIALDGWLRGLAPAAFDRTLPLLRRSFASFSHPERRTMGETVRRLGDGGRPAVETAEVRVDRERARRVIPVLAHILGGEVGRD
ncbi:MAG: hypothetical protein JOZ41_03280 [Chloroflexi bacterium]|nr:hypothetical protein [Chloroflexota bacterium]